jgi:hypothetical protein
MTTKRSARTLSLPALLFLLLLPAGCSDDGGGDGAPALGQAWSDYEQGQWQASAEAFLAAVDDHPGSAEAWCGLGWCRAALQAQGASGDLREGILGAFREADRLRSGYVDAWAGLAEFHSAANDTMAALDWALDAAATGGAAYAFAHRPAVNHRSLRKIAAWSLFKLERYAEAGGQVRAVLPNFQYSGRPDSLEVLLAGIGSL